MLQFAWKVLVVIAVFHGALRRSIFTYASYVHTSNGNYEVVDHNDYHTTDPTNDYGQLTTADVPRTPATVQATQDAPQNLFIPEATSAPQSSDSARKRRASWKLQTSSPGDLRILPLGASIVRGQESVPLNGFRKPLRDQLRNESWVVDMVGSVKTDGDMKNPAHEGHSGATIDQVYHYLLNNSINRNPNLVLINAGTNDCKQNIDIQHADYRLQNILDKLWTHNPNTTIVLSTLLPNANATVNANVDIINPKIRTMVQKLFKAGKPILLADQGAFMKVSDLVDGTHPTNAGYTKMASVWYAAITRGKTYNMIQAPADKVAGQDDPNMTADLPLPAYTPTAAETEGTGPWRRSGSGGIANRELNRERRSRVGALLS